MLAVPRVVAPPVAVAGAGGGGGGGGGGGNWGNGSWATWDRRRRYAQSVAAGRTDPAKKEAYERYKRQMREARDEYRALHPGEPLPPSLMPRTNPSSSSSAPTVPHVVLPPQCGQVVE